jgi:alpha-1,2-mannosyltransferase
VTTTLTADPPPTPSTPPARAAVVVWLIALAVAAGEVADFVGQQVTDLRVYRAGGQAFLDGADIYQLHQVVGRPMPFTYPPFAAVVFAPLAALPFPAAVALMTVLSTLALGCALRVVVRRVWPDWPDRRGWLVAGALTAAGPLVGPVQGTLALGQINLLLLALVVVDLLGPADRRGRGLLLGVAAGIKLTPAIFIVHCALTGRRRMAGLATASAAATVLIGHLLAADSSTRFWTRLWFDPDHVGDEAYVSNQSLYGALTRLAGGPHQVRPLWLVLAVAVGCWGLATAWRVHRGGDEVFAVLLTALTGLLVSPVSWHHHWVWALPTAVLLWSRSRVAAVAWTLPFVFQPIWWVPFDGGREYAHHGLQLLAGNSLLLTGLALLAAAPALTRGCPASHRSAPGGPAPLCTSTSCRSR